MDVIGTIRYTKRRQIGVGEGMNSEVFLAVDPQLAGEIAVKEIPKKKLGNTPAEYFREAQAMFAADHDNVVSVRYACETTDLIGLAMRYYPRGSLAPRVAANPLGLRELLRVSDDVLRGVGRIHAAGYIHFDIKPSNVLLTAFGGATVADFGQARAYDPRTGVVTAPQVYRDSFPPELLATGAGTVQSDVYQVGLLLYRAANGDARFKSQIPADPARLLAAIAAGRFPDRRAFLPHVPPWLRTLIRKALRTKPEQRFGTASDFADALARVELRLNWETTIGGGGAITWRARRTAQPDILVLLEPDGAAWQVKAYTERAPNPRRALGRGVHWRGGLSQPDAMTFLEEVFRAVESG
ncbi:MAG: hypothetical protein A3H96_02265 [Acidobacteria bacterium RIFCSPLOWO2_02_FULL_67_36]|nr:MAG: hypothetical protein A3H96_02265 [Acidobacteria bacterium RIFCSPLOWO2_02_FULL_67_36]